jgi:hypothetical protein
LPFWASGHLAPDRRASRCPDELDGPAINDRGVFLLVIGHLSLVTAGSHSSNFVVFADDYRTGGLRRVTSDR